jgi:hypothetical protein
MVPINRVCAIPMGDHGCGVLIIHEALYFGERLKTSTLLTPNQLRANGLVVDDVPRQFKADSTHSIFDPASGSRIPLSIKGQASGFVSHNSTQQEWNDCHKVILTSDRPWLPNSTAIADAEYVVTGRPHQTPHYQLLPSTISPKLTSTCGVSHPNLSTSFSPSGDSQRVATVAIGTFAVLSREYENTLTTRPSSAMRMVLGPAMQVLACESSSHL